MTSTPAPAPGWLDEASYRLVQDAVPIVCVDALVYTLLENETRVGLIRRSVPTETGWTEGWALVGGRVRRGEPLAAALDRHLRETLGDKTVFDLAAVEFHRPCAVGQYLPDPREGLSFDPRQHSVALTYLVPVEGEIRPLGEAVAFRWFAGADLPPRHEIGFKQDIVIEAALRALEE